MNVLSSLEKKVVAGSIVAFGILILIGLVSLLSISQLVYQSKQVNLRRSSIAQLEQVRSHLKDIETGTHGYILMGKPAYLTPYKAALQDLEHDITNLRRQFSHQSEQLASLKKLEIALNKKVSLAKKTIEIRQSQGLAASIQYLSADTEKYWLDHSQYQIAQMEASEIALLTQVEQQQDRTVAFTILAILIGSMLAITTNFIAILLIRKDVRKRQEAEEKIQKSEQLLRNAQQLAKLGSWEYDIGANHIILSDALCDIMEVDKTHRIITVQEFYKLLPHHEATRLQQELLHAIQSGQAYHTDYQVSIGKKQKKWLLSVVQPQHEADGKVKRLVGTSQDITEQKEIEEALRKSEERFATAFQLNPFPTAITRLSDGKILAANEQSIKVFGYDYQQLIGSTTFQLQIWDNIDDRNSLIERLQQEGTLQQVETKFRRKTGEIWPAMISLEIVELDQETCILWIMQDITERKREQEEIKKYSKELENLNANKDKFFSIIAHDLRSPLNGVIGSADVLAHHIHHLNREEVCQLAENIYTSSLHLKRLLNNLFDWASVQTGEIKFNPCQLVLCQLVAEVVDLLRANAQEKNIQITYTIPQECLVYADQNMLHTILRNLVSNAIKFTSQGGFITLLTEEMNGQVIVQVRDTGVGMSSEVMEKIFRIDTKHSTQGTNGERGTGLGLAICKEFVEKHGGKIEVQSQIGQGTCFQFGLTPGKQQTPI